MKPLVRILLRHGVSCEDFVDVPIIITVQHASSMVG